MTKWYREKCPITAGTKLADELMRLKRGSVSRRHFLGVTGLGLATAVLARQPGLFNSAAYAAGDLGTQMSIATLAELSRSATFEAFTAATGVAVESTSSVPTRNAGEAAGGRHRLGPLRAHELHDLDLLKARP